MPSGSVVTVRQAYGRFLNVWMWIPGSDFAKTRGKLHALIRKLPGLRINRAFACRDSSD